MNNPIQVTRSSMPGFEEYMAEIKELWESRCLTNMGSKHKALEKKLAEYLKTPNITLFANGHLALECVIASLGLTGEVITTPFTFASTTHAIVRNGLTPVFCDIEPDTYTMDVRKLERLITKQTSAIIPVHVYGNVCDVDAIDTIARNYNLKVVYDAAHAFGVTIQDQGIATCGDASMFSFHATKVFHTIEGGAVTYNNDGLKTMLDYLKNFGITSPETVDYVGGNAKMNEFQAAMGICNLRHIDQTIEKRKKAVERYREKLSGIAGIKLAQPQPYVKSNYAYFPVLFDGYRLDRNQVYEILKKDNIISRKYFYPLINNFACYRNKVACGQTETAQYISDRILTLPLYEELAPEEIDRICNLILDGKI
ncbi:MAG: dTDP-4-amino-4,6-dideoxy-D-glucose transaminase [Firmicutes bacterium]|nr:dTDP-4-amino-4,6-dideoxy-D-glucose transaminase [Bacillota bacterium]